jgi:predicted metal-dependent enzyme (double-stranded beta helix superfamily)
MPTTDIKAARAAQVAATIARIRAIEHGRGVTRDSLEAIKAEMLALAEHEHLFPAAEFPPPPDGEKASRRYLLQADADHRFAMYMNAINPGNATRPHDHTTWAVIVAVEGQEHNTVYERAPGGLRVVREVVVEPGTGIAFLADDIHAIATPGAVPTRHLHMYGLALEVLDDRQAYDPATDEAVPYNQNFMRPTAVAAG